MDTINYAVLQRAGEYVEECQQHADIHTVTLILNGAHGGVDVTIEGIVNHNHSNEGDDYKRTYQIS